MTDQNTAPAPSDTVGNAANAKASGNPKTRTEGAPRALDAGGRYLTFTLGGEVYALPILDITEIMEFRSLTEVPMMPSFVRGVINLRGRVVPVVDLAARFGRGHTQVARRTSIIIVEVVTPTEDGDYAPAQDMGIMVDAVNKVVHLGTDDIEPPPAFGAGIRTDFISGMAKYNGEFMIVLDVTRVLSVDEMMLLGHAALAGQDISKAGTAGAVALGGLPEQRSGQEQPV